MKKQQFKSSVANSSRVNNPYRRLSLTRLSTPHSKYRCINIVAKLQRLSPKENPLALAAVHKKTWKMQGGGGYNFKPEAWQRICICAFALKQSERKSETEQTKILKDK